MSIDGVPDESRDGADARRAAAEWLEGADRGSGVARDQHEASASDPPQAVWVGPTRPLEAFGVQSFARVTEEDLAAASDGRSTGDGRQVRLPEPTGREADHVSPPGEVPRLWGPHFRPKLKSVSVQWVQAPQQRAAIEQALLKATAAALEHIRQAAPLVRDRGSDGTTELGPPAGGLAAAAVVRPPAGPTIDDHDPASWLHVHTAIVGAQRSDAKIVSPDPEALAAYDMTGANSTFHRALAAELANLGYELGPSSRPGEPFEIRASPPLDTPQRQPDAITIAPSEGLRRFIDAEQQLRKDPRHLEQPWMSVSDPSERAEPSEHRITAPASSAEDGLLPQGAPAETRRPRHVDQHQIIREELSNLIAKRTDRETYRRLLGERRMGELEATVARVRDSEFLVAMETAELAEETATLRDAFTAEFGDPFESLDRRGAYDTLRVERDIAIVEERIQAASGELWDRGVRPERMADPGLDWIERVDVMIGELRERRVLPEQGTPDRYVANDRIGELGRDLLLDRDSRETLRVGEQQLKDRGVHLDQQLDPGVLPSLPRVWAREDELAIRLQVELAGLDERAALDLPDPGIQPAIPEPTAQRNPDPPGIEM